MTSIAEVLDKAADLIEPEGAWTQSSYARDENGDALGDGRREDAVCWCLIGALERISGSLVGRRLTVPIHDAIGCDGDLVGWNDAIDRKQSEVVDALRKAAQIARTSAL